MKIDRAFVSLSCVGALLVSASLLTTRASAQEEAIDCKNIPAAVETSFKKLYPQATIDGCAKEAEKGKAAFEIMSTEGTIKRDVLFYEDGKLIVAEEAIAESDLPPAVQQAMGEALADHKITLVEKLLRDDVVTYEIQSKHEGVPLEIVFDGNGKVVKIAAAVESAEPAAEEMNEDKEKGGEEEEEQEEEEGHE